MLRSALLDLWPLAAALLAVAAELALVARFFRPNWRQGWLAALHRDQSGGVQSLSFVLAAPLFIMLMMLAVQITQVMIGLMTVHYAAFAAIRSASVWIPARLEPGSMEGENRVGQRRLLIGRYPGGSEYLIEPGGQKFEQIRRAAALACVSIGPSRDYGIGNPGDMAGALQTAYQSLAPAAMANPRIPQRLASKWAYADAATTIEIRVFHPDVEPPLMQYPPWLPESEFTENEIGWRDQVQIRVTHHFALLPGPGRLLARRASESRYRDEISPQISQQNAVYTIPLTAVATLAPEGEKSVVAYVQQSP
jgi:hypothetical protein